MSFKEIMGNFLGRTEQVPDEIVDQVIEDPEADAEVAVEQPVATEIDYDRIINGVTEKIAERLPARAEKPEEKDVKTDSGVLPTLDEIASEWWEDPRGALAKYGEVVRQNTEDSIMKKIEPFLQRVNESAPMVDDHAFSKATEGLNPEEKAFIKEHLTKNEVDQKFLNHPFMADLLRSKAELATMKKAEKVNAKEIPDTMMVAGHSMPHIDAESRGELNGLNELYNSLGLKLDPAKLIGKVK